MLLAVIFSLPFVLPILCIITLCKYVYTTRSMFSLPSFITKYGHLIPSSVCLHISCPMSSLDETRTYMGINEDMDVLRGESLFSTKSDLTEFVDKSSMRNSRRR